MDTPYIVITKEISCCEIFIFKTNMKLDGITFYDIYSQAVGFVKHFYTKWKFDTPPVYTNVFQDNLDLCHSLWQKWCMHQFKHPFDSQYHYNKPIINVKLFYQDSILYLFDISLYLQPYMGITYSPLPHNNCNLPFFFFSGNCPIFILDNIY